ncbi:helix-turn-helix domain-containing protein [Micromonospora sp. DT41]|uniref:helix-turn-helix domain-containing protein n=1 Tax=Micromonospora sp. DT41 TaxID=3393437 RepID=UPI003CE8FAA2
MASRPRHGTATNSRRRFGNRSTRRARGMNPSEETLSIVVPFVPRQAGPRAGEVIPRPVRAVYTVKEVAVMLSLSVSSAYALVRSGQIPAERLGRRWVVPRSRFHAWLDGASGDLAATGTEAPRRGR